VSNLNENMKLKWSLFTLRLGVFIVFFMWTLDKFVNPGHAAAVFKKFYLVDGLASNATYIIGSVQLLVVMCFLFGIKKRITYGTILFLHSISTISTWEKYIDPWGPKNLLFFAAIPMLAAIFTLYNLRDLDDLFTF